MQDYTQSGIIPIYNDKFILIRSTNKGKFVFPKGTIKKHETALQAALRETIEETGAEIDKDSIQEFGLLQGVFWYVGSVRRINENREGRVVMVIGYEEYCEKMEFMGNKTKVLVEEYMRRKNNKVN